MESLHLWAMKALKCCEQNLMEHSFGILEDKNVERHLDKGGLPDEISEVNKESIWNWVRDYSYNILVKDSGCVLPVS